MRPRCFFHEYVLQGFLGLSSKIMKPLVFFPNLPVYQSIQTISPIPLSLRFSHRNVSAVDRGRFLFFMAGSPLASDCAS